MEADLHEVLGVRLVVVAVLAQMRVRDGHLQLDLEKVRPLLVTESKAVL